MTQSFELYDKRGYVRELARCAKQAGEDDKLTIMAMGFDASLPEIDDLGRELAKAAKRGADVRLIIDAYSFMLDDQEHLGPLFYSPELKPSRIAGSFKTTYQALENIKAQGGQYFIVNQPHRAYSFPYSGRSHIKLAIVNDRLFIGGCNMDDMTYLDLMVAWENRPTVEAVSAILQTILNDDRPMYQSLDFSDQTLVLGDAMRIFIDCGVKHQSTILRQAHQLIDEAKERIIITCQYFPGEQTAQHLLAARKRGVDVKIYFSHPTVHGRLAPLHYFYNLREHFSLPAAFFENRLAKDIPKLHAKVIVTESAAMVGSHNYVNKGVNFGTAEIAMLNHDADFAKRVEKHIQKLIA